MCPEVFPGVIPCPVYVYSSYSQCSKEARVLCTNGCHHDLLYIAVLL